MKRKALLVLAFLFFLSFEVFSSNPTEKLKEALTNLCEALRELVPIVAMLMIFISSVVYATGQMMGAETRARANVWSTSMLTGALIGILIASIAPPLLEKIAGDEVQIEC